MRYLLSGSILLLILLVAFSKVKRDLFYSNPGFIPSLTTINKRLKSVSRCDVMKIKGKLIEYIPETTPLQVKLDLNYITATVLSQISGHGFFFRRISYDRIKMIRASDKINYIYETFVTVRRATVSPAPMLLKLRINVIIYIKPRAPPNYRTVTQETNAPFTHYEIGIPSKDQLIPLPMEVIPTANEVLGTKTVRPILRHHINQLIINYVTIENSTLVMHTNRATRKTGGYNESTLESSTVEGFTTSYVYPSRVRNKWPVINKEPTAPVYNWPCTKIPFRWNSLGAYSGYETINISLPRTYLCEAISSKSIRGLAKCSHDTTYHQIWSQLLALRTFARFTFWY